MDGSLAKKINCIRKFSDKEYYSPEIRQEIVKKLNLETDYWKNFVKNIFRHLRCNGFVIIKDMPFDDDDRLLVGFSAIIGTLIEPYATKEAHMVRRQSPGEAIYDQDISPHTDGAHWPEPNDLTALECFRKDEQDQGLSRIIPVDIVLDQLKNNGQSELIDYFYKSKVPFLLHKNFGHKGWMYGHVLTKDKYGTQVRFARTYIESAIKKFEIKVNPNLLENVEIFEKMLMEIGERTQFLLNHGDLLIFDNKRVFHGRTQTEKNSRRILKKVKINIEREKMFENI